MITFNISIDLDKRTDPMRSWTVRVNNEKKFMVGSGFVYDLTLLVVSNKDKEGFSRNLDG